MQVFCTQGPRFLVGLFRVVLPLLFLTEGVSHHSFLLELSGGERIVLAFLLAAFKTCVAHCSLSALRFLSAALLPRCWSLVLSEVVNAPCTATSSSGRASCWRCA